MSNLILWGRSRILPRRFGVIFVSIAVLLVIGLYTVTDPTRITHNELLEGADYAGYAVCHRLTDRSFTIAGRQLPLCARCTGMYLGISLTFLLLVLAGRRKWAGMPPLPIMIALITFVILMGIDGLNSYSHFFPGAPHLYEPRNWLRLVTGMGTGLAMGIFIFPALVQTLWQDSEPMPVIRNIREFAGILILAAISIGLVLSNQPAILYLFGLISAGGVILILMAVNSTILLILLKKDGRAGSIQQAALPLLGGLGLALLQITVIGVVRYDLTGTLTGFPGF